jgi:polysaccharide biosynthesis protein PslH
VNMKIFLITRQFPYPLRDGESIAIQMMSKGLYHAGAGIDLLALNTAKHFFDYQGELISELSHYRTIGTVYLDNRVKLFSALFNWFSQDSYHISRYQNDEVRSKIVSFLESQKYDIIQLEGLHLLPYITTIRRYSRAKIVYRAHNIESIIWQRILDQSRFGFKKYYLKDQVKRLRQFEQSATKNVDAICCVSEEDASYYKDHNVKIKVAPIGIENIKQQNSQPVTDSSIGSRIGFMGSMDWIPNREGLKWYLDRIHSQLIDGNESYELIIAGRKSEHFRDKFTAYNRVKWLGEIDDANAFWDSIDILIVPLFAGSGTRVKIIEAIARRKGVITTSIGIEGINYQNLDQVEVVDSISNWCEALKRVFQKPRLNIVDDSLDQWLAKMNHQMIGEELMGFYQLICRD